MSITLMAVVLVLAGVYVGWNIGANDAANCIGTMVGARVMPFRRAALLMGAFVVFGGVAQGQRVMKTVGKGILITSVEQAADAGTVAPAELSERFPDGRIPDVAILVAMLSAGLFVTLATFTRVPVSTSQAIVGGVLGVGVGVVGLDPSYFQLPILYRIASSWVVSPFLSMTLAFVVYLVLGRVSRLVPPLAFARAMSLLVVVASCYVSFSLGANDVGNAIGPLLNRFPTQGVYLAVLGGVSMAAGALMFGQRVTDTVGKSITPLDFGGAFAAQASAAFGVHVFSILGIPVSTSQAVVGAVVGVGLTKGVRAVTGRKILTIVLGWVVTPLCAALFSCATYRFVMMLVASSTPPVG